MIHFHSQSTFYPYYLSSGSNTNPPTIRPLIRKFHKNPDHLSRYSQTGRRLNSRARNLSPGNRPAKRIIVNTFVIREEQTTNRTKNRKKKENGPEREREREREREVGQEKRASIDCYRITHSSDSAPRKKYFYSARTIVRRLLHSPTRRVMLPGHRLLRAALETVPAEKWWNEPAERVTRMPEKERKKSFLCACICVNKRERERGGGGGRVRKRVKVEKV